MKEIAARGRTQTGLVSATPSTDGSFVCRGGALRAGDQRVDFLICRADRGAREEADGNSVVGPCPHGNARSATSTAHREHHDPQVPNCHRVIVVPRAPFFHGRSLAPG